MGLEPIRLVNTRPSNVPVCLFQHNRIYSIVVAAKCFSVNDNDYYKYKYVFCQHFVKKYYIFSFDNSALHLVCLIYCRSIEKQRLLNLFHVLSGNKKLTFETQRSV